MPARRPRSLPVAGRFVLAFGFLGLVASALYGCDGPSDSPKPADSDPSGGSALGRRRRKGPSSGGSRDSGLDRPPESAGGAAVHEKLPPPAFRFEDVSETTGIDATNHSGAAGVKEYLLEAVGPGPACLDFDHDGLMDFYVPDGDQFLSYALVREPDPNAPSTLRSALRMKEPRQASYPAHLYRNLGNGRFEDVAVKAGVTNDRWGFGALAWDYDGDGWTDLFVSNFGVCRLYRNNHDGTFTDIAAKVGLANDPTLWNTCATCGDYDGDGRLDLFVARYANPSREMERQRGLRQLPEGTPAEQIKGRSCKWRGLDAYCGPIGLEAQHDSLFRQQDDGTFRDVTREVEMVPKAAKYGFTSYFFDYDGDGLLDVYVANDSEENFLWHQERKDGKIFFRDVAERVGVKFGQSQNAQASMGYVTADINQDGLPDIFVTNFSHDYNNIFIGNRYPGGVSFKDRGLQVMGQSVFCDLSWGCGWYDFDLDADLDLFVANGHVYKEIDLFERTGTSYEQYPAVFEALDAKKLEVPRGGAQAAQGPEREAAGLAQVRGHLRGQGARDPQVLPRRLLQRLRQRRRRGHPRRRDERQADLPAQRPRARGTSRRFLKLIPEEPGTKNTEAVGGGRRRVDRRRADADVLDLPLPVVPRDRRPPDPGGGRRAADEGDRRRHVADRGPTTRRRRFEGLDDERRVRADPRRQGDEGGSNLPRRSSSG